MRRNSIVGLLGCLGFSAWTATASAQSNLVSMSKDAVSFEYTNVTYLPAGIASGEDVFFIGDPLDGNVDAYSRATRQQIGQLPQPPGGFVIPFIMHELGPGLVGILGAGGVPQIKPLVLANPMIYVYSYEDNPISGFSATLVRLISFASVPVGFPEDFVRVDDGRILMTDSVLGSVWVVETDGNIEPGITPKTFNLSDPESGIPQLALCGTMPEVLVNGVPFLFTGSTIPGIESIAVRNGIVYFHSPCARGVYWFPLAILSDSRAPYQRAADIRLLAATPADIEVEELLEMQFNPYDLNDPFMYAAHGMQLEIIRVDSRTGARETVAHDARLFDFPSSIAFLPPTLPAIGLGSVFPSMLVVSNQQERTPITNDAVTQNAFNLPFLVTEVDVTH
jgi:hypothetical protein